MILITKFITLILTFLVFSNWEDIRVIIPNAEIKLKRLRTCVTPARSILKRFRDQLPVEIARTNPAVRWSPWNCIVLNASNSLVREGFFRTLSMADLRFVLYVLNRSSLAKFTRNRAISSERQRE